jgi:hypothetical protein
MDCKHDWLFVKEVRRDTDQTAQYRNKEMTSANATMIGISQERGRKYACANCKETREVY